MSRQNQQQDFRTKRAFLPDEVFLLENGKRPGPTELVLERVWRGIIRLPDDVALTTSNHHGAQLERLYTLWGDWIEAIGDAEDELFGCMLDAADCLQGSTFDSLHGYYRSAISNLRSALELVAIGALGNLAPKDADYLRWTKQKIGTLPFSTAIRKLRVATRGRPQQAFKPTGWLDALYDKLCGYAHARPDANDGAMWRSNGPIYVNDAFNQVYQLQVSAFATCYVFVKVGRPRFVLPSSSGFLFTTKGLLCSADITAAYQASP